ncbi:MAG: hypothetical protein R2881_08375 [Eubacteriales bacterium]
MIVSMKRMTLVAHKADETAILNALQGTGAVEVISNGQDNSAQAALSVRNLAFSSLATR